MTRGGNRGQRLSHSLDKEVCCPVERPKSVFLMETKQVYQVVRKIVDERNQYDASDNSRLSFANIYDAIRRSNSSLNRKPKKLLEDSIERVLETIQQDGESDSEEFANVEEERKPASNGLNKSIVGMWTTPRPPTPTKQDRDAEKSNMDTENTNKRRLANGEPPAKKRRPLAPTTPSIDKSPPTHVSLDSLGGVDAVIQQLEDLLVMPMLSPEDYREANIQPPRGILIHGPPGCGKTTIANAFAAELGVNFISISAPSIVSGMSGESEKALRDHFEEAKKCAPCLIFIDEIDAITPKRESAQREMEKRIVAQLSTCMDDLDLEKTDGKPVIVLAATNRPDSLDAALRRGGRFDKEINMSVPTEPVREEILRALTRGVNLADDVDFTLLARRTPGFVGADLNDLVATAGTAAMKRRLNTLKAEAEKLSMDVDTTSGQSSRVSSLRRLIEYTKDHTSKANEDKPKALITFDDFLTALPQIQPSALREGFATIPSTTFASIGALSNHITHLTNRVISPILSPELFVKLGIPPSSGTLLWGPPGCGKTLLAKACANSSHANFISVKGPELLNKYVGESERAVRQVFVRARSSVPVIIFFDELDALVPRRDGTMSEASARVVNTMLTELDGVGNSRQGIYVIAATNRPDIIDPAMLRPGRLDSLLYVGLPDSNGRVDILRKLCGSMSDFVFDESIEAIARQCEGFSGADLEALLRDAGYAAMERCAASPGNTSIKAVDFQVAQQEVKPSVSSDDMRRYNSLRQRWGK